MATLLNTGLQYVRIPSANVPMAHGSHGYCRASETNPGGHSEHSQAPKLDVEPGAAGEQSKVNDGPRLMQGGGR